MLSLSPLPISQLFAAANANQLLSLDTENFGTHIGAAEDSGTETAPL
jgi:hypothetical protein